MQLSRTFFFCGPLFCMAFCKNNFFANKLLSRGGKIRGLGRFRIFAASQQQLIAFYLPTPLYYGFRR